MERRRVSPVPACTRTIISPDSTAVPANTSSPAERSTASGSPVSAAWFTMAQPDSTVPSTLMGMPVRTAMRSPSRSDDIGTDVSWSPSTSCAVSGASRSERMSWPCERARVYSSSVSPRLSRNMVDEAVLGSLQRNAMPMAAASSTGTSSLPCMSESRPAARKRR